MNIGGIAKSQDRKFIIPSVSLKKEELEILVELADNFGVEVFFQTVPDSKRVDLEDALKLFGLK